MQPMMNQAPPPKKGPSGGMIALIVILVILVLVGGTCAAGYFYAKREVQKIDAEIKDGSAIVVISPAEVMSELAGPKKNYVGEWKSKNGSRLSIKINGDFLIEKDEDGDGNYEKTSAPIAAFKGSDIEIHELVTLTFHVSKPPTLVGDKWEMTMDLIHFERER